MTNDQNSKPSTQQQVYLALTSDDEGRLCKDIPDSACDEQPKNFFIHVTSLAASKMADGFIDPKLILTWLLNQLGTSSFLLGLVVPIREAGSLLPQLLTAQWIRERKKRKWVWAIGALLQGLCVAAMILSTLMLQPDVASISIIFLLALLAIARSFCSVSYKDVLGKTIAKTTRGSATGLANSMASTAVIGLALLLGFSIISLNVNTILWCMTIASLLWFFSSLNFLRLAEAEGATEGGQSASENFFSRLNNALSHYQFLIYISARSCLTATALAPPFILLLHHQLFNQEATTGSSPLSSDISIIHWDTSMTFGSFLLASSFAGLLSSFFWGRLSDRSSRKVLMVAATIATLVFSIFSLMSFNMAASEANSHVNASSWSLPLLFFLLMVAYQGVRLGRSVHLVDMSDSDSRSDYTAIANTVIGVVLLLATTIGLIAQAFGLFWVFIIFFFMSLFAMLFTYQLDEVQV